MLNMRMDRARCTGRVHRRAPAGTRSRAPERRRLSAGIGWGAGFLSKSSAIAAGDEDYRKVLGSLPYYERAIKSGLPFRKTRRVVFLKNKLPPFPAGLHLHVE